MQTRSPRLISHKIQRTRPRIFMPSIFATQTLSTSLDPSSTFSTQRYATEIFSDKTFLQTLRHPNDHHLIRNSRFANCSNVSEQNVEELAFLANSTSCCGIRPQVTLAIDPLNISPDTLDTAINVYSVPTFLMRR